MIFWTPEEDAILLAAARAAPRGTATKTIAADVSLALGRDVTPYAFKHRLARLGESLSTAAQARCCQCNTVAVPPPTPRLATCAHTILVCPDLHSPYHDVQAWELFLRARDAIKPDLIVIIGDFVDCYAISDYDQSPTRATRFESELHTANAELDRITDSTRVIYLEGNHEERLPRYLARKAPQLWELVSMPTLLEMSRRGWEWVPYKHSVRLGKMTFTHDSDHCGVHALRNTMLDYRSNVCFGHTHRGGVLYDGTVRGEHHVGLNVGWLGDIERIDYAKRDKVRRWWQHGFGLVRQDESGNSHAQFVPIISGSCCIDGRIMS
jgi:predicted phosphodiesterase